MSTVTPQTLPLYVVPDPQGGFKIGIKVSLDQGKTFNMYEFDTGGTGFYSAYDDQWFPVPKNSPNPPLITQQYSSGIVYNANPVSATITFENSAVPAITADVAQIITASCPNKFTPQQWQNDVNAGTPPLYGAFFGDFGVSLGAGQNGVMAVLPQSTTLGNGFIIDLGPFPGAKGGQGSLQLGLTPDDIASFPYKIPMLGKNTQNPYPGSGLPTYAELIAAGTLTLGTKPFSTDFVFDTGAPSTMIHYGSVLSQSALGPYVTGKRITKGKSVGFAASGWGMTFPAGDVLGRNEVGVTALSENTAGKTQGYVNSGLLPFFTGRVMFDVAGGVIGFDPR